MDLHGRKIAQKHHFLSPWLCACRKIELFFFLVCQLGMQQGRQRVREREFVKAQSGSLASLFQIPEVFSALEGLELIWLSGFPL